jgi:hypothetical protein
MLIKLAKRLGKFGRVPDYKSAIRQNAILRYAFGQAMLIQCLAKIVIRNVTD